MNIKISEMSSATSLDGTELVPIVQSGVSKKATVSAINSKPYGRWILNDSIAISPISSYQQNLVKMVEQIAPNSSVFSYNATTGIWTLTKAGKYRIKINCQCRGVNSSMGTLNAWTSCMVGKGFGIGDPSNLNTAYTNCSQICDLAEYCNLFNEFIFTATAGQTICAEAYCRVMSGSAGSNLMACWGSERTSIDIEYIS